MDLYDVMRTTFAARQFTDEPVPDEVLWRILDNARFGPSGGNRQGWRVIVVRDPATKQAIADCAVPAAKRYTAQVQAGENPWNTINPGTVTKETIAQTKPFSQLIEPYVKAPVVLVVCVDLKAVASIDQYLPRVGIVSGASVYPFVWNLLLAARNEGYGGTITTLPVAEEPRLQELLGLPPQVAVCAVIPFGRPVKQLTKLKRRPVSEFAVRERWGGEALLP